MEQMIQDPSTITFAGLFVALLVYVIKNNEKTVDSINTTNKETMTYVNTTNKEREDRYNATIRELTSALNDNVDVKQSIQNIEKKVSG